MFTKVFWLATGERAISTGAQFAFYQVVGVGVIAGAIVPGEVGEALNAFGWNWMAVLSSFCAGAFLTLLKCLAVAKATNGSPSANNVELLAPEVPTQL